MIEADFPWKAGGLSDVPAYDSPSCGEYFLPEA